LETGHFAASPNGLRVISGGAVPTQSLHIFGQNSIMVPATMRIFLIAGCDATAARTPDNILQKLT
jgi:hypothetical protein